MEATLFFNDKIIFLSDISYIERKETHHKKKQKDSAGLTFPEVTYDIVMYLRSSGRSITTWYPNQLKRDEDYKKLIDLFANKDAKVNLFESLFGTTKDKESKED